MAQSENPMVQNRSMLKDFVASIATMSGDLSNITAPPFVLDTKSTVELPQYWADHPSIFCAPAKSSDPAERAMLVLRWYISSLRNQNYMGRGENDGLKKPLNAFLGELFLGSFEGEEGLGETRLVGEQVSHHPPITACRVWNDTQGVIAEGYTRQTITFSGNVTIQQNGHAMFTLTKHDNESYLIPLPTLKIRGILSGAPYPELSGKYYIPSTSGYTSVIDFSGKGWFGGGKKNSLYAKVYHEESGEGNPIYTIKGQWNGEFVIHDMFGKLIETFDMKKQAATAAKLIVDPIDEQDPWETRRAWKDVIGSLNRGDMPGTSKAKSIVEQGQRNMRKDDQAEGRTWEPVFFRSVPTYEIAETLESRVPGHSSSGVEKKKKDTLGIWVFEEQKWRDGQIQQPYHGDLMPDNTHSTNRYSIDSRRNSGSPQAWNYDTAMASNRSDRSSVASIYSEPSSRRSSIANLAPTTRTSTSTLHTTGSGASSPRSPRASIDSPRDSSVYDMSSLRRSMDGGNNNGARKISLREQSIPQTQDVNGGASAPDLSIDEKRGVEDFLRDQYSSGRRKSTVLKASGLRQESRA